MSEKNLKNLKSCNSKRTLITRTKSKHGRPCDGCALRKVRCDSNVPCSRCLDHNLPCTNIRTIKKCGPKTIHDKTRRCIEQLTVSSVPESGVDYILFPAIPIAKVSQMLQIFHTWFYSVWPVLSSSLLISKMGQMVNENSEVTINAQNATEWALACSVAAAIYEQLEFLSKKPVGITIPLHVTSAAFARESIRIRQVFDCTSSPSIDTLLCSFFLFCYYGNFKTGKNKSILFLREAISTAQLLGLHEPKTFMKKTRAERHRMSKVFYILLVTERFTCIESGIPILLEANIPLPNLECEEYPEAAADFLELAKIFSIPNKSFFEKLVERSSFIFTDQSNSADLGLLYPPSSNYIIDIQNSLSNISIFPLTPALQKLNIILSKYWMQCLVWYVSQENDLLVDDPQESYCLSLRFPLHLMESFLNASDDLDVVAFESNGPGIGLKLLVLLSGSTIAYESLLSQLKCSRYGLMTRIYNFMLLFKAKMSFPKDLVRKMETIVLSRSLDENNELIEEVNSDVFWNYSCLETQGMKYRDECNGNNDINSFNDLFCD
ncbi:uncharacterized protein PRCAT00001387001 [Priceomyces carsonii]|uniref:uncharacterized protein n=1 Tax=Priceomyces carsonii TaxID=28549 RepID=UPI002ED874E8|nr:unnamed protein product [Priceomyces carsonii]